MKTLRTLYIHSLLFKNTNPVYIKFDIPAFANENPSYPIYSFHFIQKYKPGLYQIRHPCIC